MSSTGPLLRSAYVGEWTAFVSMTRRPRWGKTGRDLGLVFHCEELIWTMFFSESELLSTVSAPASLCHFRPSTMVP